MQLKTDRPYIYAFIGKQGSGKSHLVKSLFYNYNKAGFFDFGLCYSPSAEMTGDFDFLPENAIFEYSEEHLMKYLETLKQIRLKNKGKKLPNSFIIFDDNFGTMNLYTKRFMNFLACYRHYGITIFIVSQRPTKGISTDIRTFVNKAFMFRTSDFDDQKLMYHSFGGMFEKFKEFKEIFLKATERKFSALCYENDSQLAREQAYTSVLAPSEIPDFRMVFRKKGDKQSQGVEIPQQENVSEEIESERQGGGAFMM